jgi:hypothetical protein
MTGATPSSNSDRTQAHRYRKAEGIAGNRADDPGQRGKHGLEE